MMMLEYLETRLDRWNQEGLSRIRSIIEPVESEANQICIRGDVCTNFSSNDYLGLNRHPKIAASVIQTVKRYGFGSGASALICGYSDIHARLEQKFATWLGVDRALLFPSGYLANLGVFGALANRSTVLFSDRYCHASILDGIQLSRARNFRYRHRDLKHFHDLAKIQKPDLIVSESVFGMSGNIAPLEALIEASEGYNSTLVIDDAHGIGILGNSGRGIIEFGKLDQHQFGCIIIPLGKAFNGIGAMVVGRHDYIETIFQFSKSYRYTTAMPPVCCSALEAALEIIKNETWRQNCLTTIIQFFIQKAAEYNLSFSSDCEMTPIKSLILGDNKKTIQLQSYLRSHGFYVSAIRPPTVSDRSARIRISLNCLHTEEQVNQLLNHIAHFLKKE